MNPLLARYLAGVLMGGLTSCVLLASPARLSAQGEGTQGNAFVRATTLGLDYSYADFEGDIDPWHLVALSLGRQTTRGSAIGRVNLADRFATTGSQFEIDAYPRLGAHSYGYVNAGYSASSIFPEWRFGGEVFRSLPRAWEASAGFRQLRFGGPPVTLFTGSVGKYTGNYWLSLRPYIRDKDTGLSASASLTVRRYYADGDNYVGGRIGYGSTPSDNLTAADLARTRSATVGIQGSRSVTARTIATWSATFEREELSATHTRNRWEISAGGKFRIGSR